MEQVFFDAMGGLFFLTLRCKNILYHTLPHKQTRRHMHYELGKSYASDILNRCANNRYVVYPALINLTVGYSTLDLQRQGSYYDDVEVSYILSWNVNRIASEISSY